MQHPVAIVRSIIPIRQAKKIKEKKKKQGPPKKGRGRPKRTGEKTLKSIMMNK